MGVEASMQMWTLIKHHHHTTLSAALQIVCINEAQPSLPTNDNVMITAFMIKSSEGMTHSNLMYKSDPPRPCFQVDFRFRPSWPHQSKKWTINTNYDSKINNSDLQWQQTTFLNHRTFLLNRFYPFNVWAGNKNSPKGNRDCVLL